MLGSTEGVINQILLGTGLINESIGFLSNPNIALFSIIAVNVWIGIPFNLLLISTGLSNLPDDVYEAASIEGASSLQQIFYITLPMLKPVLLVVIMLGFIYTFKVFDLVFIMTGGGPINATEVLSTVAYRYSFVNFDFGLGAAAANILFIILFLISLVYLMMTKTEDVK